jgi:hypothetical protein
MYEDYDGEGTTVIRCKIHVSLVNLSTSKSLSMIMCASATNWRMRR